MKVFLSKIRNNKAKLQKVFGIVTVAVGLRYGKINLIPTSLSSTQSVEVLDSYFEEDIQLINTNSQGIKTGSGIFISNQQISEGSKSALKIRCGDFRKSGLAARAKADARANFNKKSVSTIIPGASASFTPHQVYRIYHEPTGTFKETKLEVVVPSFNDANGVPPRIAPSVSSKSPPNQETRMKSQPLKVKSEHQKADVLITNKDVKKWITPEQRKETSNQKLNERKAAYNFADIVRKPDEVLDGIHIHREQKNCKVYIKNVETSDGTKQKLALIADSENGRAYLGSALTEQEYSNCKKTGKIDLSDLRRDPQTLVMNQKSIQEAEALNRAKAEGCLSEFTDIRRPYNVSESLADFVGKDSMGSKIDVDIKGIDRNGRRPLNMQTQNIHQNIKDLFNRFEDPTKIHIICDISAAPTFLQ